MQTRFGCWADRSQASSETLESARKFGEGTPYDDVELMLAEQKPDVVHVCSPNHFHKAHAISSFAAGAHVLCEKPLATSIVDGQEMIEAARRAQRVGVVMYHNRGYPLVQLMKERVAALGASLIVGEIKPAAKDSTDALTGTTLRLVPSCASRVPWTRRSRRSAVCCDGSKHNASTER